MNSSRSMPQRSRLMNTRWPGSICLAKTPRGVLMAADHGEGDLPAPHGAKRVPVTPPLSLVNGLSLRAFNAAILRQILAGRIPPALSAVFLSARCDPRLEPHLRQARLLPVSVRECHRPPRDAIGEMLDAIASSGQGSFLAVLKNFGDRPTPGLLSFPMPGTTLALDFPNHGASTLALFERLDAIVRAAGGRLYAAKDARMPGDFSAPRIRSGRIFLASSIRSFPPGSGGASWSKHEQTNSHHRRHLGRCRGCRAAVGGARRCAVPRRTQAPETRRHRRRSEGARCRHCRCVRDGRDRCRRTCGHA